MRKVWILTELVLLMGCRSALTPTPLAPASGGWGAGAGGQPTPVAGVAYYPTPEPGVVKAILAQVAAPVEASYREVLGICGSTGNSSGPHLHFQVQPWNATWGWMTVDPSRTRLPGAESCQWESLRRLP